MLRCYTSSQETILGATDFLVLIGALSGKLLSGINCSSSFATGASPQPGALRNLSKLVKIMPWL
jgi:hypothetical protein